MNCQQKEKGNLSSANPRESVKPRQLYYHSDLNCPVCLQTAAFPVETNCGHLFCGSCLIAYWRHGSWPGAVSCPLCRQKVVALYNLFCENQQDMQGRQIRSKIRDYNKRFSGQPRPFADYLYDMPLFIHLALKGVFTLGGLVWIFCLRIIVCSFGAIMCLTSPFDVMAEPLCGILGVVDDLVVVFLLVICMTNIRQQIGSEGASVAHSTAQSILSES
ncbi:E3 ubiquitin-protein ligase RNF170-like isoform X2 [Rhinatrema bivittatum]|nr:E3 ubiquitin-protein ligase RNF170-like isoform X2 [Rhinatrema bivittatum]XP_029442288.1 E3 ubiquitin-protein ligase RNF170-like isoform X2 [Rhinatrema bivittatum]XP_029474404.1 E3 ubiquitin-protein ligase RNF170-like isoform X2 [Rhinatrema bivittatum]XP_029474405.1 E3 ubiquitin-protein ligase RNF170-like isoform X2 [Rhinatrema bivittatum]